MPKSACRHLGIIFFVAVLTGLTGCAFAPGMYAGDGRADSRTDSGSSFVYSGDWFTPAPGNDGVPDTLSPDQLIPITAALVNRQRAQRSTDIPADVKKLFAAPKPYQIGTGDVLNIFVWDHPELLVPPAGSLATDASSLSTVGNGYNVSPEGAIQFPYVGTLKMLGLTEYQARNLLVSRLSKYIKDPQVTLRIQSYRSSRVYIDGEVRTPGLQTVNDIPMTLPEAIARAGGFTPTADRSSIAISRDGSTVMVNMALLTERGVNPARILLNNGDLVRVLAREEAKVFVLGEVLRPNTQTLRNGRLTLNEALGEAGGVSQLSGDPRQIFVIRAANAAHPEIYHLDARAPAAFALAEAFELQARDVIYVDPVPLVRWSRVVNLILPSAVAANTTRSAVN